MKWRFAPYRNIDTVEKPHQGKLTKIDENERKVTNIRDKYEKVGFDVKKESKGVRYIPFRVRYGSKQMRERLIPHSFYIIFSEDSDFEVEK